MTGTRVRTSILPAARPARADASAAVAPAPPNLRSVDTKTSSAASGGVVMACLHPFGHVVDVGGIGMVALPPARVEVEISSTLSLMHVMPDAGKLWGAGWLDGSRHQFAASMLDGVSIISDGFELEARGTMNSWALVVEFDRKRLMPVLAEALDGAEPEAPHFAEHQDRATSTLARLAIDHLRCAHVEPLYLDGIGIAIIARQLDIHRQKRHGVSTSGTERRIDRTIEYIEAHLDRRLSVTELASVAIMSPTWFSASFRARTGRSVHAWVVHRRLERARELLRMDARSIAEVALSCGFSSQTHLTTRFGQAYGITPARWRAGA